MVVALQLFTWSSFVCCMHSQDIGLAFPVLWSSRELLNKASGGFAPQPSPSQLTNDLDPLPQILKKIHSIQTNSPIPDLRADKSSHSPGGSAMATSASPTPRAAQEGKKTLAADFRGQTVGLACSSGSVVEDVTSSFNQEATGPETQILLNLVQQVGICFF